jgi:hypothetical protein
MLQSPLVAPAVFAFLDFTRLRNGLAECSEGPTVVVVCTFAERAYAITTRFSMARAIRPVHGAGDGNVLFTAGTSGVFAVDSDVSDLGVLSFELACAAVLKCVRKLFTKLENFKEGKS